jgi:NAD+ kinase
MNYFCCLADSLTVVDVEDWIVGDRLKTVDDPREAQAIIVAGGDGTMLHAIHDYWQFNLPFIGINRGTVGFLMNPIITKEHFFKLIENFKLIELDLMDITCITETQTVKLKAFNDVYLNVRPGSICHGYIEGSRYPRKEFYGDGIIVATPQGSTAYNRNAGGSVLPLKKDLLAVTTICAAQPIRDTLVMQNLSITIVRGEMTVNADNQSVSQVKSIEIRPGLGKVSLAFDQNYEFDIIRYSSIKTH